MSAGRHLSAEEFNLSHLPRVALPPGAASSVRSVADSWFGQMHARADALAGRAEDVEAEASDWLGGYDVMQVDDDSQAGEIRQTQQQVRGLRRSATRLGGIADQQDFMAQQPGYRRDPRRAWN